MGALVAPILFWRTVVSVPATIPAPFGRIRRPVPLKFGPEKRTGIIVFSRCVNPCNWVPNPHERSMLIKAA